MRGSRRPKDLEHPVGASLPSVSTPMQVQRHACVCWVTYG